jgi:hypothetical protein
LPLASGLHISIRLGKGLPIPTGSKTRGRNFQKLKGRAVGKATEMVISKFSFESTENDLFF